MLLIDSLDGRTIDHSSAQIRPTRTKNDNIALSFSQKHKIPELNHIPKSFTLPSFQTLPSQDNSLNKLKFTKIIRRKDSAYRILITFHSHRRELLIEVKPILNDLNSLKTSKSRSIHALSFLSTINPNYNLFSFRMNVLTNQIFISSALIFATAKTSLSQVNRIITSAILLFQQKKDCINTFVSEKGFLNTSKVILNESFCKYFTLISQLLNNSCQVFNQMITTSDSKSTQACEDEYEEPPIQNKVVTTLTTSMSKTLAIKKYKIKSKVNKYDIVKLLTPVKQNIDNTINHLCIKISIEQSNNIKWQSFCSNKNNKIQLASVKLHIQNNHQQVTRWLIRKKPKTINGQNQFENSKKVFECLKNKNCVNILQAYVTNEKDCQNSMFTDFCRYGSLSTFLKTNKNTISLRTKIYFMLQIAFSLQFLKNQNIVHMDIKPSNFLVAPDLWVKLTDFGQATFYGDKSSRGWTPPYVAPQRFQKRPADYNTDIYSFGVLMYEVITGKLLFSSRTQSLAKFETEFEHKIPSTSFNPESFYCYGPQQVMIFLHNLIIKCVNPISCLRPTIQQVILIFKSLIGLMQNLLIKNS